MNDEKGNISHHLLKSAALLARRYGSTQLPKDSAAAPCMLTTVWTASQVQQQRGSSPVTATSSSIRTPMPASWPNAGSSGMYSPGSTVSTTPGGAGTAQQGHTMSWIFWHHIWAEQRPGDFTSMPARQLSQHNGKSTVRTRLQRSVVARAAAVMRVQTQPMANCKQRAKQLEEPDLSKHGHLHGRSLSDRHETQLSRLRRTYGRAGHVCGSSAARAQQRGACSPE
jgi:hypothetical protein